MPTTDTVFRWIRILRAAFFLLAGLGMLLSGTFLLAEKHEGPNGDSLTLIVAGLLLTSLSAWVLKRAFTRPR